MYGLANVFPTGQEHPFSSQNKHLVFLHCFYQAERSGLCPRLENRCTLRIFTAAPGICQQRCRIILKKIIRLYPGSESLHGELSNA